MGADQQSEGADDVSASRGFRRVLRRRSDRVVAYALAASFLLLAAFPLYVSWRTAGDAADRQRASDVAQADRDDQTRKINEQTAEIQRLTAVVANQSAQLLCYADTSNAFFAIVSASIARQLEQSLSGSTDPEAVRATLAQLLEVQSRLVAARAASTPCPPGGPPPVTPPTSPPPGAPPG